MIAEVAATGNSTMSMHEVGMWESDWSKDVMGITTLEADSSRSGQSLPHNTGSGQFQSG